MYIIRNKSSERFSQRHRGGDGGANGEAVRDHKGEQGRIIRTPTPPVNGVTGVWVGWPVLTDHT